MRGLQGPGHPGLCGLVGARARDGASDLQGGHVMAESDICQDARIMAYFGQIKCLGDGCAFWKECKGKGIAS